MEDEQRVEGNAGRNYCIPAPTLLYPEWRWRTMTKQGIDWSGCELVEVVPGKVSGAPILKGTRLPAQTIIDNHDYGMTPAEIVQQFGVTEDQVRRVLDYARRRARGPARPHVPGAARP